MRSARGLGLWGSGSKGVEQKRGTERCRESRQIDLRTGRGTDCSMVPKKADSGNALFGEACMAAAHEAPEGRLWGFFIGEACGAYES